MGGLLRQMVLSFQVRGVFAFVLLLGASAMPANAQSYLQNVAVPPFTTKVPVENGFINAANGNLHLEIPLGSFPQRVGAPDKIVLMYDSAFWYISAFALWEPTNISNPYNPVWAGWRVVTSRDAGYATYAEQDSGTCGNDPIYATYSPWIWVAPDGTQHSFPVLTKEPFDPGLCGNSGIPSAAGYANDGSGFYISITNYTQALVYRQMARSSTALPRKIQTEIMLRTITSIRWEEPS